MEGFNLSATLSADLEAPSLADNPILGKGQRPGARSLLHLISTTELKIGTQEQLAAKLRVISDEWDGTPNGLIRRESGMAGARSIIPQQYLLPLISILRLETEIEKKLAAKLQEILHECHGARNVRKIIIPAPIPDLTTLYCRVDSG